MVIQQRDKRLLADLHRYGILSSGQIQKIVFKNVHPSAVLRRLRKLEKGKYIIRVKGLPMNESGWSLSEQGARQVGETEHLKYQNQNTTHHEVLLSEVRLMLESLGLASDFVTEASLRRQEEGTRHYRAKAQNNIPDGIFVASALGTPSVIAVELEITAKNHARYEKVLTDYAAKSAIRFVWYLAGSQDVANAVFKVWQKIPKRTDSPELLVSYTSEFFENPGHAKIWTQNGTSIELSRFFGLGPSRLTFATLPHETGAESPCPPPRQGDASEKGHPR